MNVSRCTKFRFLTFLRGRCRGDYTARYHLMWQFRSCRKFHPDKRRPWRRSVALVGGAYDAFERLPVAAGHHSIPRSNLLLPALEFVAAQALAQAMRAAFRQKIASSVDVPFLYSG